MNEIPDEILLIIIEYLDLDSIINFGLTCWKHYILIDRDIKYKRDRLIAKRLWGQFTGTLFSINDNPMLKFIVKNRIMHKYLIDNYRMFALSCDYVYLNYKNCKYLLSVNEKNPNYIINRDDIFSKHYFYLCD